MLDRCLRSVRAALGSGDELVVVDSASQDRDAVAAAAERAGALLVRSELAGVNRARNLGWRRASHALVAFTDDDVTVDAGWADAFARCLAVADPPGFVTGRIDVPEGQARPDRPIATKVDAEAAELLPTTRGDLGHGASMAATRAVLEAVGGFDECLGAGGRFRAAPEYDLFDRIFALGATGRYEPAARAWHDQWRDDRATARLDLRYGFGNGARLAKLVRSDRRRARQVAREALWDWGLLDLVQWVRTRQRWLAIGTGARLVGTIGGFASGMLTPVVDGHYRPRRLRAHHGATAASES